MVDLDKLQAKYKELYDKEPPNRWKTDTDWLMKEIDRAVEKGVTTPETTEEPTAPAEETLPGTTPEAPEPEPAVPEQDPPKTAAQERAELETESTDDLPIPQTIPQIVADTAKELEEKSLIGKFYTGDGEGGNWQILINEKGTSIKNI